MESCNKREQKSISKKKGGNKQKGKGTIHGGQGNIRYGSKWRSKCSHKNMCETTFFFFSVLLAFFSKRKHICLKQI